jgi:hypothetical protein
VLVWVRGRPNKSVPSVYLDMQGLNVFQPLPSPGHNLDKASLRMARLSMHLTLPQAACCHTETEPELSQLNTTDVTQVTFTFIGHTLEVQIFCLHAGLNLAVGKELFNESQSHIILHPFYIQHCVRKTWKGWGPNLLVDWASHCRFSPN